MLDGNVKELHAMNCYSGEEPEVKEEKGEAMKEERRRKWIEVGRSGEGRSDKERIDTLQVTRDEISRTPVGATQQLTVVGSGTASTLQLCPS